MKIQFFIHFKDLNRFQSHSLIFYSEKSIEYKFSYRTIFMIWMEKRILDLPAQTQDIKMIEISLGEKKCKNDQIIAGVY